MTHASDDAADVRTVLTVEGMTCGNCVHHVEEALAAIDGVHGSVDLADGTVVVDHPASVTLADLVAAVDDAGYEVAVRAA